MNLPDRAGVRRLATLAALLALVSAAVLLWVEREHELATAATQSSRQAEHLAEHVQDALVVADVALRQIEAKLNALPPGTALDEGMQRSMADIGSLMASLPLPLSVQALGADGRAIGPNTLRGGLVPPALPLPEGSGWRAATTVGAPGQRVVPLVRRAAAGRHGVSAWLVALDHEALVRRFDDSREREGGGAALYRAESDGSLIVLARAPHDEADLGQRVRPPMAKALPQAPKGSFVGLTQLDQVERVVAHHRLAGDAAELAVGHDTATEAVLAPWRSVLPWVGGLLLLLLATLAFGTRRLDRALLLQGQQQLALRQSEAHFRSLADNVPDVVVRMDREGRHLYANPAVQQATGLAPEDFIGKTNADLGMPAANVSAWTATLRRVFEQGRSERLEFAYPGPGGPRHWESVVALEPLAQGAPPTVLVISRDITERKQAEADREAMSRRMVDVLETMSDGFVSLDRQWRYQAVNRKAGQLLGRDAATLIGKHIWTEFPEGVGQPFQRAYERAMNEGVSVVLEEHYAPWDKWFENRIHPSPDGISVFFTEITERVRAARALQASEAHHRELFESNPHPMWVCDLDTLSFLAVNDAAVHKYGYSRDEFLRMSVKDIRPPEDVPRLVAHIAAITEGIDDAGTWRHRTKDGRLLEVEITSHTLLFGGRAAELVLAHDVTRRNAAERELRANEERLRLALQAADQGLYDLDLRTGEAVVSPEYARMLGWEPEEFHETNAFWRERLHPDDQARVYQVFEDYVAGRRSDYRVEFRQRTRDGGWKWILSLGQVQERDAQGRPVRMLGTHTDITAIKQAQAAQAESEARLRYLLSRAPAVIYTARAEGEFPATYYSPNLTELLGWRPEQFLQDGGFWLDHMHPQDRPDVLARIAEIERRDSLVLEYRFQHADGSWRWMRDEVGVERGPDGRPIELVGSWIDITDRWEAEDQVRRLADQLEQRVAERTEQLARSEARYRTIFETVPVSIGEEDWSGVQRLLRELRAAGVTDATGYFATRPDFVQQCLRAVKLLRLNQQALALHDVHDKPAAVTDLESFYPRPEDLPQFVGELEAMWAGQRLFTAKRELPSVAGRPLRLMLTMSLPGLDDDDGTALVCLVDITELDRLNTELDRSVARLREANRELETFTYSVSHDLKAPLRGIDGYSRLLLTDHRERLDDEGREFLEHIRHATKHMGVLIDDLLSYSRLERRELTLAHQPLGVTVDLALSGWRSELAAAGVQLEVHIDPELRVQADAQGLILALRNLIDNAIKFSRASVPPRITIEAVRRDGGVELSVRDNGVGFDMKFHDRIFSIFQRLHRSEDYPGTGIGLAIVRKAMERMGGHVRAHSRPGEGATFTLLLPQADPT